MSDRDLVVETVRDILTAHEPFVLDGERPWDAGLWAALAESGMTGVGLDEKLGGSGGEYGDAVAIVATLAAGAGAVPVAEQLLVAGPALVEAGTEVPDVTEPLTVAVSGTVTAVAHGAGYRLSGTATDVPWLGAASRAVIVAPFAEGAGGVLALVDVVGRAATGANLAGEPQGTLEFDGTAVTGTALTPLAIDRIRARFALARAVQISAALEQVLAWTVAYVGEREQFGRPLAKFQAVQMDLARMAGEVAASAALTDAAVQVAAVGADQVLAAAAAKIRAGAAVEVVARQAHQLHGAIGFTQEHRLHHLTRRLWSWRDEAGGERHWAHVLGARLPGGQGLWPALTEIT